MPILWWPGEVLTPEWRSELVELARERMGAMHGLSHEQTGRVVDALAPELEARNEWRWVAAKNENEFRNIGAQRDRLVEGLKEAVGRCRECRFYWWTRVLTSLGFALVFDSKQNWHCSACRAALALVQEAESQ